MDGKQQQRREPDGIRGSWIVLVFFLILGIITVGSYLAFRFLLDIPTA